MSDSPDLSSACGEAYADISHESLRTLIFRVQPYSFLSAKSHAACTKEIASILLYGYPYKP